MGGALGVGALVGAFYLGSRAQAVGPSTATWSHADLATIAPAAPAGLEPGLAVECEPGQRAIVRTARRSASTVACVTDPRAVSTTTPVSPVVYPPAALTTGVVTVADGSDRPHARPAVLTGPTEVYVPRARTAAREVAAPKRSVQKSVAIIAGSTAVGAVAGGLVKGTKGAVVGGLLGGGAATVWDQVTRRQHGSR